MRFQSGITDQYIYFVAVDATDLKTRKTGLTGFTVYRSRNGGAAAAFTTPTINETDTTNMPGVYELLLDEDMTIDSGDDSQAVCLHITCTGMAPVTLQYELYRPVVTAGQTATITSGGVTLADGVSHGGTLGSGTATLALSRFSVVSQSANTNAITATGNGTGHGAALTSGSGATGNGLTLLAASTNGHGLKSTGTGTGDGAELTAGASGADLDADIAGTLTTVTTATNVTTVNGLAANVITAASIATGAIDADAIADNAIDAGAIASGAITSAKFAAGAIDASAIAADAIGASELAADAVTEIANAVWDTDATGRQTQGSFGQAIGDPGADTDSIWALVNTNLDATISSRLASASYTAPLDAAGTRTAIGLASANLDTQLGDLPTANENADALLDRSAGVETNRTLRQTMRLIASVLLGKISGGGTGTEVFRDTNDSKDRVTATVDSSGNRTAITYDAS